MWIGSLHPVAEAAFFIAVACVLIALINKIRI